MLIRPSNPSDLPVLLEIEREAGFPPMLSTCFGQPGFLVLVADVRGIAQGYVLAGIPGEARAELRIGQIWVKEGRWRRLGVATSLVRVVLRFAVIWGVKIAVMECRRSNLAAQDLARSLGGKRVGIRERYYPDGEDALVFATEIETIGRKRPDSDPKLTPVQIWLGSLRASSQ